MPPPPPQVSQWLKRTYPKPTIDPEWLEGCYTWIQEELRLDPARDMPTILENVNTQLLGSDFADSMVAGTGFPQDVLEANHAVLKGPLLVEVTEVMEIGHSAYSLLQVHESRAEYRKQAELRDASGDAQEQKPMPKYPRSMLQFRLSDGASVLPAIEFKPLPQFELGETPLGYKMIIRDVTIRRGTAFLEPRCVELKGHQTADRDERREATFLRGLKLRLGEEAPADEPPAPQPQPEPAQAPPLQPPPAPARAPAPAPAPARAAPTPPPRDLTPPRRSPTPASRSPLREISPLPSPSAGPSNAAPLNVLEHADDAAEPRRRKRPTRAAREPSPDPPPRAELLQRSRFFGTGRRGKEKEREEDLEREREDAGGDGDGEATVTLTGPGSRDAMKEFARTIGLSPPRATAIDIPDNDGEGSDEDAFASAPPKASSVRPLDVARAKAKAAQRAKEKQKEKEDKDKDKGKDVVFGAEPSSDDYGFDFEMDDSFLEFVSRAEEESLKDVAAGGPPPNMNGKSSSTTTQRQARAQTQVGIQLPRGRAQAQVDSQATLFSLGGTTVVSTASTVRDRATSRKNTPTIAGTSSSGPRATSIPHTSSKQAIPIAKRNAGAATATMDVIDISEDEEEIDKENVPVPTRHVRRRVIRQPDADVIELSD